MKVLIVCSGNALEGQIFDLKLQHAFIFEQVSELQKMGVTFDFFYIKGKGVPGYLKSISELRSQIKTSDCDLVHAHYGLSAMVATFQRRKPLIATFHGCDVNRNSLNLISSFVALFSKANIFVSEDLRNKIIVKTPEKNRVIPCGVDLNQFKPGNKKEARTQLKLDQSKKYILFASARDVAVKNYTLAKQAIGNLPESDLLEISGRSREEVNLLMNACDVFLMTSFREGSPQTIKEAMACNCPIVSTSVGDVKNIFANTEGCFLTSFDPADVAEKLNLALEFAGKNGRTNGRKRIMELGLDSETIAGRILEVYKEVLGRK